MGNSLMTAPDELPVWLDGLTAKQCAFVEAYARTRNAVLAYDDAYDARGGKYQTRAMDASRLMADPRIKRAIAERQKIATEKSGVDAAWLLERFLRIGTADPRELIGLKVGASRYCYGEGHGYHWREREFMEALAEVERHAKLKPFLAHTLVWPDIGGGFGFNATLQPLPECPQCHGEGIERFVPRDSDNFSEAASLLYGGVKVKKDGYEIIIADRQKALELAGRIIGAYTENHKHTGAIANLHAIKDLRSMDPADAAKVYRQFIASDLAVT